MQISVCHRQEQTSPALRQSAGEMKRCERFLTESLSDVGEGVLLFWHGPAVFPPDALLDEHRLSVMRNGIAVADEKVAVGKVIGGRMTCGLKCFLVAFDDEGAAAGIHRPAVAVEIRPRNGSAATHGHAVGALLSTATVVPTDKEVIPTVVFEKKGSLDGVGACMLRGGVSKAFWRVLVVSASDGARPAVEPESVVSVGFHGFERRQLYAVPERPPCESRLVVIVDDEVGINGVPVVALFLAGYEATLVPPVVFGQRGGREQTDGRGVLAEGGTTVSHPPAAMPTYDVRCPDVRLESWHTVAGPGGNIGEHAVAAHGPCLSVPGGHHADIATCIVGIVKAVLEGHDGVVDEGFGGFEGGGVHAFAVLGVAAGH